MTDMEQRLTELQVYHRVAVAMLLVGLVGGLALLYWP